MNSRDMEWSLWSSSACILWKECYSSQIANDGCWCIHFVWKMEKWFPSLLWQIEPNNKCKGFFFPWETDQPWRVSFVTKFKKGPIKINDDCCGHQHQCQIKCLGKKAIMVSRLMSNDWMIAGYVTTTTTLFPRFQVIITEKLKTAQDWWK